MDSKQAMKRALEALESCGWNDGYAGENQYFHDDLVDKAIASLREALAEQPAQQITEAQVEAALKAAHMHSTPESRKDMRRALEASHGIKENT